MAARACSGGQAQPCLPSLSPPPRGATPLPPPLSSCRQTKLRVVLSGPPKPPSPVPEGNEGDDGHAGAAGAFAAAGTGGAAAQGLDALARERDRLREALARAERDRAGAQARLDAVAGGGGKLASKRGGGGGFSVVVLVLVALLAFAAGHFLAKGGLPALKK